jgi:hypothetical protein
MKILEKFIIGKYASENLLDEETHIHSGELN